jgi:transposase-like protein
MIFPITELLDETESLAWVEKSFHPKGLTCPGCGATREHAREFRKHKRGFVDYRCSNCQRTYTVYTGTVFAGSNLELRHVGLLIRGVCKGDPATLVAEELARSRQCIHRWRKRLHANGDRMLRQQALRDRETETDEMFQNAGEKRRQTQ